MRGFTLIELLIVLGILLLLTSVSIQNGLQGFERTLAQSDTSRTSAIVRHARAQSMHAGMREVTWSAPALSIDGPLAEAESYPLSGYTNIGMHGVISFTGVIDSDETGSLILRVPSVSAWEIRTGHGNSIDIFHTL